MSPERLTFEQVVFSAHAVRRIFEREFGKDDVVSVLDHGEVIDSYPEDRPYPSYLLLGFPRGEPLHVVAGIDESAETAVVVTAYVPDPQLWDEDFRSRRKP